MKILILATFLLTIKTYSQGRNENFFSLSIGPGVAIKNNIRPDNTYDRADEPTLISPIPYIQAKVGSFRLRGRGISYSDWIKFPFFRYSLNITRSGERYYGPGMERKKDSWFAGGAISFLFLTLSYSQDIQKRSHGKQYRIGLSKRFPLEDIFLRIGLSMNINDDSYTNYYFGVLNSEQTATRRAYTPGRSVSYNASVMGNYSIDENWKVFSLVSHQILGTKIRNSPTTKTDRVNSLIMALLYKF